MDIDAFRLAQRFIGVTETPGHASTPQILSMLRLDAPWPDDDLVPWCSAFVNYVCWLLRLPRSKSLLARSWLHVGSAVPPGSERVGYDVAVFKHLEGGHVGFWAGTDGDHVLVLGGNQHDSVNVAPFPESLLLGVRRLT